MPAAKDSTSIRVESQKGKAYRYIRSRILSGKLGGGDVLSELVLSKEVGISRTPIREAMSQLVSEGLLEQLPGRGTFVTRLTRTDLVELFELREALEVYAVRKAAQESLPLADCERLEQLCAELAAIAKSLEQSAEKRLNADQMELFLTIDLHFHLLLLRTAGNRKILKVIHDTHLMISIFAIRRPGHDLNQLRTILEYHRGILEAVKAGDQARAAEICTGHIRASRQERLDAYDRWERVSQISLEDILLPGLMKKSSDVEDKL
jgi:DNA-binding GntR family transcriptional regulator